MAERDEVQWLTACSRLYDLANTSLDDTITRASWRSLMLRVMCAVGRKHPAAAAASSAGLAPHKLLDMLDTDWKRIASNHEVCSFGLFASSIREFVAAIGRNRTRSVFLSSIVEEAAAADVSEVAACAAFVDPAFMKQFAAGEVPELTPCSSEPLSAFVFLAVACKRGMLPWPYDPSDAADWPRLPHESEISSDSAGAGCEREEHLSDRPMSALRDNADCTLPDDELFAWARDARSTPPHVLVVGAAHAGKTTLALRLAHMLRARYIEPRALVAASIATYRTEYNAALDQARAEKLSAARQRASQAVTSADGDTSEDGKVASEEPALPPLPVNDNAPSSTSEELRVHDFLDLSVFGSLGRACCQALAPHNGSGTSGQPPLNLDGFPVESAVDAAPLTKELAVAAVSAALVDALLHDAAYVMDSWLVDDATYTALDDALRAIGEDAEAAHASLSTAMYRLFVDAAAGRESTEVTGSPSSPRASGGDTGGSPRDDASVGSARSRSHVRFADGTKTADAQRRGSAAPPSTSKSHVSFSGGTDAEQTSEEDKPVTYDSVAAALATAKLQQKTTLRLWHSRRQRAVLQAALVRLDKLRRLRDRDARRELLPQQIITLTLPNRECAHRQLLAAQGASSASLALTCGSFLVEDPRRLRKLRGPALPWLRLQLPTTDGRDEAADGEGAASEEADVADDDAAGSEDENAGMEEGGPDDSALLRGARVRLGRLTDALAVSSAIEISDTAPGIAAQPNGSDGVNDDEVGAERQAAPEPMPDSVSAGRVFVPLASGLPDIIVHAHRGHATRTTAQTQDAAPAGLLQRGTVPSELRTSVVDADQVPATAALRRHITVDAQAPLDDVMLIVLEQLGSGVPPFATPPGQAACPPARWLRLPEDLLSVLKPGSRDDDGPDSELRRQRMEFLLRTPVSRQRIVTIAHAVYRAHDDEVDDTISDTELADLERARSVALQEAEAKLQRQHQAAEAAREPATETGSDDAKLDDENGVAGGDDDEHSADAAEPPSAPDAHAQPEASLQTALDALRAAFPVVPTTRRVLRRSVSVEWKLHRFAVDDIDGAYERLMASCPGTLLKTESAAAANDNDGEAQDDDAEGGSALTSFATTCDSAVQDAIAQHEAGGGVQARQAAQARIRLASSPPEASRRVSSFGLFCPVSLLDEGLLVEGRLTLAAEYRNFIFVFADAFKLQSFLSSPRAYLHRPSSPALLRVATLAPMHASAATEGVHQALTAVARALGLPVVDVQALLQRKVAAASGPSPIAASPHSIAAQLHTQLQRGGPVPAGLLARTIQSEIARLAVAPQRSAAAPALWDAAPDPELAIIATSNDARSAADAAEVENAVSQTLAGVAKKKLAPKKLEELAATERARVLALQKKRVEREAAAAAAAAAHDSDDEMDPETEESSNSPREDGSTGGSHAQFHASARAFDLLPRRSRGPASMGARVSRDAAVNLEAFTNRMRLHHVLKSQTCVLQSFLAKLQPHEFDNADDAPTSPRDVSPRGGAVGDDPAAAKGQHANPAQDAILQAVRNLTGIDVVSGFVYGDSWQLQTFDVGKGEPLSEWARTLHGADAVPCFHLVDDTVSSVAKQLHACAAVHARSAIQAGASLGAYKLSRLPSMDAAELARYHASAASATAADGSAPWVIGLLGQDARAASPTLAGSRVGLFTATGHANAHLHDVVPQSYMLIGVPASVSIWKALAQRGIVPDVLLTIEPQLPNGAEFPDADTPADDGVIGPDLDVLAAHAAISAPGAGTALEPLAIQVGFDASQHTMLPLQSTAARVRAKVDTIGRLLQRYGCRVRRTAVSAAAIAKELAGAAVVSSAVPVMSDADSAGAADDWTHDSQLVPHLPVACTIAELKAVVTQAIDPFALLSDDAEVQGSPMDAEPLDAVVLGLTGRYCPVSARRFGMFVPGRDEPACRVCIGGRVYACASPAAARALRLAPRDFVTNIVPPQHCVLVAGPALARVQETAANASQALGMVMVHIPSVLQNAKLLWQADLAAADAERPSSVEAGVDSSAVEDAEEADGGENPEPPAFPLERAAAALAASIRDAANTGRPIALVWEGSTGFDADLLDALSQLDVVPSVVLPLDWNDDEVVAYAEASTSASGHEHIPRITANDEPEESAGLADRVALDRSAFDSLVTAAQAFGSMILPPLSWRGFTCIARAQQKLHQALQPFAVTTRYCASGREDPAELEASWSGTPLGYNLFSRAHLAEASQVVARLNSGEWIMSRFGTVCPVAWRDDARVVTAIPALLPESEGGSEHAGERDGEEVADDDTTSSSNVSPTWPVVIGSVVYVCSTIDAARRMIVDPERYTSWRPPHARPRVTAALVGTSEPLIATLAALVAEQTGATVITPHSALETVLSVLPHSSIAQEARQVLVSGAVVGANTLRDCMVASVALAAATRRGYILCGSADVLADAAVFAAAEVRPSRWVVADAPSAVPSTATVDAVPSLGGLDAVSAGSNETEGDTGETSADSAWDDNTAVDGVERRHQYAASKNGATLARCAANHRLTFGNVVQLSTLVGKQHAENITRVAHAVGTVLMSVAQQNAEAEYRARWGRAHAVHTASTVCAAHSSVCPVQWAGFRDIVVTSDAVLQRSWRVAFRGRIFDCSSAAAAEELLRHPTRYLAAWRPPTPSERATRKALLATVHDTHETSQSFAGGVCPVCLSQARQRLPPSALESALTAVPGSRFIALEFNKLSYLCCSEDHANSFARRPAYFAATPGVVRPAVVAPPSTENFAAVMLQALHERAATSGDYSGYLESSVLPAVDTALRSLQDVRDRLVAFDADLQLQPAILRYLSLHLRAHNVHFKPHIRARIRRSMALYMEEQQKLLDEVLSHNPSTAAEEVDIRSLDDHCGENKQMDSARKPLGQHARSFAAEQ